MSSPTTTSISTIQIRVLSASNGACYHIAFPPNELTVANIRRHLVGAVPLDDQILLLGPPYKVPKDSTLRSEEVLSALRLGDAEDDPSSGAQKMDEAVASIKSGEGTSKMMQPLVLNTTERSGAKRLFLFSKRLLSDTAPPPTPCTLEPMDLVIPTTPDPSPVDFSRGKTGVDGEGGSTDSAIASTISPLHQALEVYERRFMLHLCQGRALADGADLRLVACRRCVAEQAVMARALRAAVSNLADHRNGAARTRTEFTATFHSKTSSHGALLQRFESLLASLGSIQLHPSLVAVARASGRVMETVLDTVPVDRERQWAVQCHGAHQRLLTLFSEVDTSFAQLGTPASREEEARQDLEAEEGIKALSSEVEGQAASIRDTQGRRLNQLTSDHREVVEVVTRGLAGVGTGGTPGISAQEAFTTLEKLSTDSANILPSMEADDKTLRDLMTRVADSKTNYMKRMRSRLRQISVTQSGIQRVLSSLGVLREALAQQSENMTHLEHVSELPASYRDFLAEIRRRRAYSNAVASSAAAMVERLASMREDEVKARERFLRGSGRHLMPAFFEVFAPTLATPPPLFTPQLPAMVELDTLPDIGLLENPASPEPQLEGGSPMETNVSTEGQAGSLTSTLTDSNQQQMADAPVNDPPNREEGGNATGDGDNFAERQSLIVSADEASGDDDVLMGTRGGVGDRSAEAEAQSRTLEYENAVLRQALEKLGGKPPRTYIEDARKEKESAVVATSPQAATLSTRGAMEGVLEAGEDEDYKEKLSDLEKQLAETREELKKAREDVNAANTALVEAKKVRADGKVDDRISHSSFSVGDVALFMPTGRPVPSGAGSTATKRTYLAFHTTRTCPHRYLSTDSLEGSPNYVLGRIVYQEELVAKGAAGGETNPYGLHPGTHFWVLTVEIIHAPEERTSVTASSSTGSASASVPSSSG